MTQHQKLSLSLAIIILLFAQTSPAQSVASASFTLGKSEMLAVLPGVSPAGIPAQYPRVITTTMMASYWSADANQTGAQFGNSVSAAGDVNGDGYADVIVGAPRYSNDQTEEGRAYVYYGSAAGLPIIASWTAESNQAGALFGTSVSVAGDINGDGFADVIVGAPQYANGQTNEGRVYIYYGSAGGLATTAGSVVESDLINAMYGSCVGAAGDVNGDGFADVILGALQYNTALVYYGSAAGLVTTAAWTIQNAPKFSSFGWSAGTAGDVNGDGYDDVIVGAIEYDNGETNEGAAFVYFGSVTGLSINPDWFVESNHNFAFFGFSVGTAGDVNGDGFADIIVGASNVSNGGQVGEGRAYIFHGSATGLSTIANWVKESDNSYANYGRSVSTAGDVNADGFEDIIVGAPYYRNGEVSEGRVFVYLGSPAGLSGLANWTAESNLAEAYLGISVSRAGDVNGDGFDDILVGASNYNGGGVNGGRALVYFGDLAPLANASLDQTVATLATVTLDASASSHPDGDTLAYQWTQTAGIPVVLSDAAAFSPTFTAPSDPTTLTFTLVVSDGHGLASLPDEVSVAVTNQAPTANAGLDQSVDTLATVTLDASGSADADGDTPLAYRWVQNGGTAVVLSNATAVTPTFTAPSDPAALTFSLVVTDSLGLASAADTVSITVNNQVPLANAGTDRSVNTLSTVTLSAGGSSDPDNDTPLSYQWTQTGGSTVTLNDVAAVAPAFTAPFDPATLTFSLTVTDSLGLTSAPDEVIVTVNNQLPVANAGPNQTVASLVAVTLDGSLSSDPDVHLPLTYYWTQTSGASVTLDDPSTVQPTFTAPAQTGDLTFSLVVKDSLGSESAPDEVIITISNQAPIANAGPDQFVSTLSLVTLDGSLSSDPDGNLPLVYQWTQTGGTPVTLDDPTTVQPTFPAPSESDKLTFALVVRDRLGAVSTLDWVVITVQGCNLYIPFLMR